jgi:hypothetical protein
MIISSYRIVRRAFGEYHSAEVFDATWLAAMNIAMKMEAYNNDGEYLVYRSEETYPAGCYCPPCPVQSAFAYL